MKQKSEQNVIHSENIWKHLEFKINIEIGANKIFWTNKDILTVSNGRVQRFRVFQLVQAHLSSFQHTSNQRKLTQSLSFVMNQKKIE